MLPSSWLSHNHKLPFSQIGLLPLSVVNLTLAEGGEMGQVKSIEALTVPEDCQTIKVAPVVGSGSLCEKRVIAGICCAETNNGTMRKSMPIPLNNIFLGTRKGDMAII